MRESMVPAGLVVLAVLWMTAWPASAQAPPDRYELQVYDSMGSPVGAVYSFPATAANCTVPDNGPPALPVINPGVLEWVQAGVTGPMEMCTHDASAHLASLPIGAGYLATLQAFTVDGAGTDVPSGPSMASNPFSHGPAAPTGLRIR